MGSRIEGGIVAKETEGTQVVSEDEKRKQKMEIGKWEEKKMVTQKRGVVPRVAEKREPRGDLSPRAQRTMESTERKEVGLNPREWKRGS